MASGRAAIPVRGFRVDVSAAAQLAAKYKDEATRAPIAIRAANTILAQELQAAEASELAKAVKAHGRPQRGRGAPGLGAVLKDEKNRDVTEHGFTVNIAGYLDDAALYWRQLEHGAEDRKQILRGLFVEGGKLVPPNRGSREAYKFAVVGRGRNTIAGRGGDKRAVFITMLVGPRDPYRYIDTAVERVSKRWTTTRRATNVYRRALADAGLPFFSQFNDFGTISRPRI